MQTCLKSSLLTSIFSGNERASFPTRSSNWSFPELMLFLEDEPVQGLTRRSSGLLATPSAGNSLRLVRPKAAELGVVGKRKLQQRDNLLCSTTLSHGGVAQTCVVCMSANPRPRTSPLTDRLCNVEEAWSMAKQHHFYDGNHLHFITASTYRRWRRHARFACLRHPALRSAAADAGSRYTFHHAHRSDTR